jgi:hypothetical protein
MLAPDGSGTLKFRDVRDSPKERHNGQLCTPNVGLTRVFRRIVVEMRRRMAQRFSSENMKMP